MKKIVPVANPYKEHDLKGLLAFCRNATIGKENLTDDEQESLKDFLMVQYPKVVDVYLKNHDEYRNIQTQVYTILSALAVAIFLLSNWTFNGYPVASLGLLCISIFIFSIGKTLTTSIYRNRHYHTYSACVIRAIEDYFLAYNMPLRQSDYHNELPYIKLIDENEGPYARKVTSLSWKKFIERMFMYILPSVSSLITILGLIKLINFIIENGGLSEVLYQLLK